MDVAKLCVCAVKEGTAEATRDVIGNEPHISNLGNRTIGVDSAGTTSPAAITASSASATPVAATAAGAASVTGVAIVQDATSVGEEYIERGVPEGSSFHGEPDGGSVARHAARRR